MSFKYIHIPVFLMQFNVCYDELAYNFGVLDLYSLKENSLSALLHNCMGKKILTYYFNENKVILDITSLYRYE